jgi:dihydroorotate dehydrogenase
MSQSDYIRYKKTSTKLLNITKLDPVLESQDYTEFKKYYLESNVINTKPVLNKLTPSGYSVIFDITKKISDCPIQNFIMCNHTQTRENRILVTGHT